MYRLRKSLSIKSFHKKSFHNNSPSNDTTNKYIYDKNYSGFDHLHMREAMAALEIDLTNEAFQALMNKKKDSRQNSFVRLLTGPSRCCRSFRTQRRLATAAQHSIDIAIKNVAVIPKNYKNKT